jgi:hypothetical protein
MVGRRWRVSGIAQPRARQGEDVGGWGRQNRAPRHCGRLRYLLKSSTDIRRRLKLELSQAQSMFIGEGIERKTVKFTMSYVVKRSLSVWLVVIRINVFLSYRYTLHVC